MNPKPFDSLNHFTVPTATWCSLRTGAMAPPCRPLGPAGPAILVGPPDHAPSGYKKAAGIFPAATSHVVAFRSTARLLLERVSAIPAPEDREILGDPRGAL